MQRHLVAMQAIFLSVRKNYSVNHNFLTAAAKQFKKPFYLSVNAIFCISIQLLKCD